MERRIWSFPQQNVDIITIINNTADTANEFQNFQVSAF